MSANPNSLSNLYSFNLPSDFFTEEIEKKWLPVIKNTRSLYSSVEDFINSTIKESTLPSYEIELSKQTIKRGKKVNWKPAQNINDIYSNTLEIKFKSVEAHLSYFILKDIIDNHYMDTANTFIKPFTIFILSRGSNLIMGISFSEIIITNLSELTLSKIVEDAEQTFSMTFVYNFITYDYFFEESKNIDNYIDGRFGPEFKKIN